MTPITRNVARWISDASVNARIVPGSGGAAMAKRTLPAAKAKDKPKAAIDLRCVMRMIRSFEVRSIPLEARDRYYLARPRWHGAYHTWPNHVGFGRSSAYLACISGFHTAWRAKYNF